MWVKFLESSVYCTAINWAFIFCITFLYCCCFFNISDLSIFVAREIMHVAAQSLHEYVWHVKWDKVERGRRLGRSNSHPPDHESYLTSELPTRWRACKLRHCAINPNVAFWYDYLSPAWMLQWKGRHFDSWWCTTRDELGCRTAKEDYC